MTKNSNSNKINYGINPVKEVLFRFNTTLFIIVITTVLIATVLLLKNIFDKQALSKTDTRAASAIVNENSTTTTYLNKLVPSSSNSVDIQLPSGRINPFAE